MNESNKLTKKEYDIFSVIQNFNSEDVPVNTLISSFPDNNQLKLNEMSFFRIEQLLYDSDYPRREAFENVLRTLDNEAFNFVYILTGSETGVELCIGVVKNKNSSATTLNTVDYGKMIKSMFEGNFNGSKLIQLKGKKLTEIIIDKTDEYTSAGFITGIPSVNDNNNDSGDFQGIDRLINSMLGLNWRMVVVCEPLSKNAIHEIQEGVYQFYDKLASISKLSMQSSRNYGASYTEGKSINDSRGRSHGTNSSRTDSDGTSNSSGTKNSSKTNSRGISDGISEDHSEGKNNSTSVNGGVSSSWSMELTNKKAMEIMKYIDEELLERLSTGMSKGLYSSSVYYMADNPANSARLRNCLISLFQGDCSSFSPLISKDFSSDEMRNLNVLKTYQNQFAEFRGKSLDAALIYSRPTYNNLLGLSTLLTAKEISLFTGLPQTEVPGIVLNSGVNFGLNENKTDDSEYISLGHMIQKGRELTHIPMHLSKKLLSKHTFVAGVTGSGKTTTCHRLLDEVHKSNIPFMIIEPAKTEYRTLINKYPGLTVFTFGNESCAPFRLNPFELIKGEIISSHIDMLKATFTSAFPMEASMPQILEEAMYECYKEKGWNVITNKNRNYGENAWDNADSFPILSDLLENIKKVSKRKGFGAELQANYIGSLVSRLSNLTVGSKGCMLNCKKSINFHYIVNNDVVFELEELKSPEDKALIMGLILARVSSVIKNEHKNNNCFRHITLVEEAHRLLSKPDFADTGARKAAVETFTDLLAEVRKYGEGLVIVDQIPNKLAPEVLKNTNTKIIHKILARDDKEVVGDTMLMDDKQKEFLSALSVGQAIVFTETTDKPVHIAVEAVTDTNEEMISDSTVKQRFDSKRKTEFNNCYADIDVWANMDEFYNIINGLRVKEISLERRLSFIQTVNTIHDNSKIDIKSIWEMFIDHAITETSNDKNKFELLMDFFTNKFMDDNFSVNSLGIEEFKLFGGF